MSFDLFFQGFRNGDVTGDGTEAMREALRPYIVREDLETRFAELRWGTDTADVQLADGSMIVNHVGGHQLWDVLVKGAQAANWTILPMGCAPCITHVSQRDHLPEGMAEEAVLVSSGDDLLRIIQAPD